MIINSIIVKVRIECYSDAFIAKITSEIGKIWNGDLDGDDEIDLIKTEILELLK